MHNMHSNIDRNRQLAGFTCFELLLGVVWVSFGIGAAVSLYGRWGWIGIPIGFTAGIVGAGGIHWLFFKFIDWWIPEYPVCECGASGRNNYDFEKWSVDFHGHSYICKICARKYFKTERFVQLRTPDGSMRPYMYNKPFGRWIKQEADLRDVTWPPTPTERDA